jgi:hypothetical protein
MNEDSAKGYDVRTRKLLNKAQGIFCEGEDRAAHPADSRLGFGVTATC